MLVAQCNDDDKHEDDDGEYNEPHDETYDDILRQHTRAAAASACTCSRV